MHYFKEDLTPNEAHFVRWHLSGIPSEVDLKTWKLEIKGNTKAPLLLTLDQLRKLEPVSIVAVNQCSGNSRSLFDPRVAGGQWRNGAMGNARWTGVRLKDLLDRAGIRPGTVQVSFRGLDKAPLEATPAFEKSLPLEQATHPDVLVAYEMNGKPLPMLNGFPVRLVVPGWYATYWVKSLTTIRVLTEPLHTFWMDKAYRIPNNRAANETAGKLVEDTVSINKLAVHSIFVSPEPGQTAPANAELSIQGLAMDAGSGIARVEFSPDSGQSWTDAKLDTQLGLYSWRRWRFSWKPPQKGKYQFKVRATSRSGETQLTEQWNHSGYQRSLIEHMEMRVV